MATRKIFLVSPREPSGATWLINCFLELGIKTSRNSLGGMWSLKADKYILNKHEFILKKWLPVLSKQLVFSFNDDLEVVWTHEWPTSNFSGHQVIYFVRDPRDAIYSRYKRENPQQSYREFIEFPDVHTLLDKIDNWCVFNYYWLAFNQIDIFRFEDYKADAADTLKRILDRIGFSAPTEQIERVVAESTYEKAAEAEQRYLKEHPEDSEMINRSGKPGGWRENHGEMEIAKLIEARSSGLLHRFGYPTSKAARNTFVIPSVLFFSKLITNPFATGSIIVEPDIKSRITSFAQKLDLKTLVSSSCRTYEATQLIESVVEYYICHGIKPCRTLPALYAHYGNVIRYHRHIQRLTGDHMQLLKVNPLHLAAVFFRRIKSYL